MTDNTEARPPVWQLIKDAMDHFGKEVSYGEIKQFVWWQYPDVKATTLTCQIIICSVNHPSRIHYPENKKPREANSQYDFLFHTKRGHVAPYDVEAHGLWEIVEDADGGTMVHQTSEGASSGDSDGDSEETASGLFALEAHLRDYLAKNLASLASVSESLALYQSEDGRDGVEFQTDVGPIDVLAVDDTGKFYVLELKLSKGPDKALGQILRYMGWVKKRLAKGNDVAGVIIAADMSDKLRYAVSCVPDVSLLTYKLKFEVQAVPEIK